MIVVSFLPFGVKQRHDINKGIGFNWYPSESLEKQTYSEKKKIENLIYLKSKI